MFDCCISTGLGTQEPDTSNFDLEDGYYGQIADGSECLFWGAFPFDHNIYFGGEGVEAYAVSHSLLGQSEHYLL
jgi:hypothetical protein